MMASFSCFLVSLTMITLASIASSPLQALSTDNHLSKEAPLTIAAAPAVFPGSPIPSPYTELSPDIAPLLPSPGGALPTIPSNPSPPNPDQAFIGPDSAFPPSGSSLQDSSSVRCLSSTNQLLAAMLFALLGFLGFGF